MQTIICDIDGTLTNMWPIEKAVLVALLGKSARTTLDIYKAQGCSDTYQMWLAVSSQKKSKKTYLSLYQAAFLRLLALNQVPKIESYWLVTWLLKNRNNYIYVYATGGQQLETLYVLEQLKLKPYFRLDSSIDKSNYPYSKKTGLPFKKIKRKWPNCILLTDSQSDIAGAQKAGIPYQLIQPQPPIDKLFLTQQLD